MAEKEFDPLDPRVLELQQIQRDMIELNRAGTMIRGVLPRGSDVVIALEHEIIQRFKTIQHKRRELISGSVTEAGNAARNRI